MHEEFLLEIGTEEIPAGYIEPALSFMRERLAKHLAELNLSHGQIETAATPRRLTICVKELANRQPDRREEVFGPPRKAAFDQEGNPTKAAYGFARSKGAEIEDIQIATTPKGEYLMLIQEHKGEDTISLLSRLLPDFILSIPFAKSMHWSSFRVHFARPIQWLLALYGEEVVPFAVNDLQSGNTTRGHRFMAPENVAVTDFDSYRKTLLDRHVVVDMEERRRMVENEVREAAVAAGGELVPDSELIDTVTNLVELPVAVSGTFDRKFLELPREVLITSMREHQKYFSVADGQGNLLPAFIAINNTRIADRQFAAEGHERVLRARLEDALFFFQEDQHRPLTDRLTDLAGVVFQAKLGTMLEKCGRLESLAGFLSEKIAPERSSAVREAARLAKADLVTDMVGEFPSLQGVMGRHYALQEGMDEAVALAIQEHYLPLRAGSELPTSINGALVSLADRFDTIAGCFGIGQIPTGTTDPYGLRRHSLAILHIIGGHGLPLSLTLCIGKALELYGDKLTAPADETARAVLDFMKGRYQNDLIAKGIPAEAVEAVLSVSFDDVNDCRQRIDALMAISTRETFTLLAAAFKRVINIIKDHQDTQVTSELLTEPAEQELYRVYMEVAAKVEPLIAAKEYDAALEAILAMKGPVDDFFDAVMVMAEDEAVKNNRLSLLAAIARLFLTIGDFSKMYMLAGR